MYELYIKPNVGEFLRIFGDRKLVLCQGNGGLGAKPQEAEGVSFFQIVILTRKVKHRAAINKCL